ncbi:hypothetical protein ACWC5I_11775, partial [Kitasatospora sp. NPDC001574]
MISMPESWTAGRSFSPRVRLGRGVFAVGVTAGGAGEEVAAGLVDRVEDPLLVRVAAEGVD